MGNGELGVGRLRQDFGDRRGLVGCDKCSSSDGEWGVREIKKPGKKSYPVFNKFKIDYLLPCGLL